MKINLKNKSLGRISTRLSSIINFSIENKIYLRLNLKNIKNINFNNKEYFKHSKYPGGEKLISRNNYFKKNNGKKLLINSVLGMIKKTSFFKKKAIRILNIK
ncbi:uL13 family ribosomal protein [Candidatus Vidania fulgoroideorum]